MLSSRGEGRGEVISGEEFRVSLFFMAIFLVVGSYTPFMPVWLESRGLGAESIGLALALPLLLRPLVAPIIGIWADSTGAYRLVSVALSAGALAALLLLSGAQNFPFIALWLTLYAILWKTQVPLADTVALSAAARGAHYGRMRLWGSMSFVAATFFAGAALDKFGPASALAVLAIATASVLVTGIFLPDGKGGRGALAGDRLAGVRGFSAGFRRAAAGSGFWTFLAATAAIQASHATYYTFGTVHWLSLGASGTFAAALWTIGVLAEVMLFAGANRVLRHVSPLGLIAIAGSAGLVRWTALAFDPPWAVVAVLQLLHGLTFGAAHLGAMFFIANAIPLHFSATAQIIYGSVAAGVAMALATAAVGPAYEQAGAFAYLPMAVLGGIGLALALLLIARKRNQPQSSVEGGETSAPL